MLTLQKLVQTLQQPSSSGISFASQPMTTSLAMYIGQLETKIALGSALSLHNIIHSPIKQTHFGYQ
jgi:hypothetical protein